MNFALAKTEHAQVLPALPIARGWSVEIAHNLEAAEAPWRELMRGEYFGTAFQDFDLCALWFRHVGAPAGYVPAIVIGRDREARAAFLWPLVSRRVAGCCVASFFCGRHANFGAALWRRDIATGVTAEDLQSILTGLASSGIDALVLFNQPPELNGLLNPFLLLPHSNAPDKSYSLTLEGTGEEIIGRHFNADTRRKLRRKERHLARLPGFRYVRAASRSEAERFVSEFMRQKAARLAARGIGNAFDEPGMYAFLRAASLSGLSCGSPLIEIHALQSDDEILALFAGIHDRDTFSTMFNSYTLSENARMSPGLILLMKLVDDCARRGFRTLSLGIGAAEYKQSLCDRAELPFDTTIGLTVRGNVFAPATRAWRAAKGTIKNNQRIWSLVTGLRAKFFARA